MHFIDFAVFWLKYLEISPQGLFWHDVFSVVIGGFEKNQLAQLLLDSFLC